jgi:hypothetical protein
MSDLNIPVKETKKKSNSKQRTHLNVPEGTEEKFFRAKMLQQQADYLLSEVRIEASNAVFEELDKLEEGRIVPSGFQFGDVKFDTSSPKVPSKDKEDTMSDIGIDTGNAFPVQATNPKLFWEIIKQAGIAKNAEKLLKLINRASNGENENDRLTLELLADSIPDDIGWDGGEAITAETPRKPKYGGAEWLKLIHTLPPAERDQFINNIGLSASLKADKVHIEANIKRMTATNN